MSWSSLDWYARPEHARRRPRSVMKPGPGPENRVRLCGGAHPRGATGTATPFHDPADPFATCGRELTQSFGVLSVEPCQFCRHPWVGYRQNPSKQGQWASAGSHFPSYRSRSSTLFLAQPNGERSWSDHQERRSRHPQVAVGRRLCLRSLSSGLVRPPGQSLLGVRRVSRQDPVGAYPASYAGHFTRREGRPQSAPWRPWASCTRPRRGIGSGLQSLPSLSSKFRRQRISGSSQIFCFSPRVQSFNEGCEPCYHRRQLSNFLAGLLNVQVRERKGHTHPRCWSHHLWRLRLVRSLGHTVLRSHHRIPTLGIAVPARYTSNGVFRRT
jgi:hypothetical protein